MHAVANRRVRETATGQQVFYKSRKIYHRILSEKIEYPGFDANGGPRAVGAASQLGRSFAGRRNGPPAPHQQTETKSVGAAYWLG